METFARRGALGLMAAGVLIAPAAAMARLIPQRARARVIIDNDFSGDPDGLVAMAHQLLSPRTRTVLAVSSYLSPEFTVPGVIPGQTAQQGRDMGAELIRRLKIAPPPPVVAGAEGPIAAGRAPGPAAQAIVAEAMRDDPLPLTYTCGGPLTNLAEALMLEPRIATRMKLAWIGGGAWPAGGWEYNLAMDAEAARQVIERSAMPMWQVPQPAYRQMVWSLAEMQADMRPISPFSRWLYDQFTNPPDFVDLGGGWPMGDSPLVLITALNVESSIIREVTARRIQPDLTYGAQIPGRTISLFERVDARLIHADFLARLKIHAG